MTTLKGVFPEPKPARKRNFIHENVKNLRRMEQCFHTNKGMEELQNLQLHRQQKIGDKYQNVTARVNSSFRDKKSEENNTDSCVIKKAENQHQLCRKSSAPALNKDNSAKKTSSSCTGDNAAIKQTRRERKSCNKSAQKLHGKILSDPNLSHKSIKNIENHSKAHSTKYKSQGIQTLDTKEMDDLYSQGMIRYPSKKCINHKDSENKVEMAQHTNNIHKEAINSPSDRGDTETPDSTKRKSNTGSPELHVSREEIDFIKLNKERTSAANRTTAQLNSSVPLANYRKGVVPKYIRERKEAYEREQKEKAEASHPDCPEGHVPLPDHERKETLHMLKKNYQENVNELNKLPIKTDTLRAQRRKMEIEKQLNKLEEGIKVFSRPKVYVKVNA